MDNSQRNAHNSSEYPLVPQSKPYHLPCGECRGLDCHSIHGPVARECLLKQCYICEELAEIDALIAETHKNLVKYVDQRQKILAKPPHDPIIHRMPVEIVSSIFVFVKDALLDVKVEQDPNFIIPGRPEHPFKEQPSQSPPLLVGAVCKRWRDISLQTACLWTDIMVNLNKYPDGQFAMIKKWARRSGILPLNISIYEGDDYKEYSRDDKKETEDHDPYEDVLLVLRSLAPRWNDVALDIPDSFFYKLANNVQEAPGLRTLYLTRDFIDLEEFDEPYILCPRNLLFSGFFSRFIPLEWDHLVYLEIEDAFSDDVLQIIRHAPNLQRCVALSDDPMEFGKFQVPSGPIIHTSLIYLKTLSPILGALTLPSLVDFDCSLDTHNEEDIEAVSGFLDRSRPPLKTFFFRASFRDTDSDPHFDRVFARFPAITSLFLRNVKIEQFLLYLPKRSVDTVLSQLKNCIFQLRYVEVAPFAWDILNVFVRDASTRPHRRQMKIHVYFRHDGNIQEPPMYKETFVDLLTAIDNNRLEMCVILANGSKWDLCGFTANYYHIDR